MHSGINDGEFGVPKRKPKVETKSEIGPLLHYTCRLLELLFCSVCYDGLTIMAEIDRPIDVRMCELVV